MTIRTIIVDDEKLAIQGLMLRLEKFPDVEVIETCANGREAIRRIKTEKPDLVFLDIQMPGFDGFSVVKGLMVRMVMSKNPVQPANAGRFSRWLTAGAASRRSNGSSISTANPPSGGSIVSNRWSSP